MATEANTVGAEGTAPESVAPVEPPVVIHVNEEGLKKHPTSEVRWCFSDAMLKRITDGLKEGRGYRVLLVAKRAGDYDGVYEMRAVADPLQSIYAFEFKKPGKWTVSVVLFERTSINAGHDTGEALEQSLRVEYLKRKRQSRRHKAYATTTYSLADVQSGAARLVPHDFSTRLGVSIAAYVHSIELSHNIFAPEPPEALSAFANYFFKTDPLDTCMFLRRLLAVMIFPCFGFVPYLLWEVLKRCSSLLFALILLGVGFEDWWMLGDVALEPRVRMTLEDAVRKARTKRADLLEKKHGWLLTPILFPLYAAIAWLFSALLLPLFVSLIQALWHFLTMKHVGPHINPHLWSGLITVLAWGIGLTGGVVLFAFLGSKALDAWKNGEGERNERSRKRTKERELASIDIGKVQAQLAERYQGALVCGATPTVVSVQAVPRELRPRSFSLWYMLWHRGVCKPMA